MKRGGLQTKHAYRLVVPGLTCSKCCGLLLLKFKLLQNRQAAGICSSAGEKVTAISPASWSVLIKSGLQQTDLTGERWQQRQRWALRKKRAVGITTPRQSSYQSSQSEIWDCWYVKISSAEWEVIYNCDRSSGVQYTRQWLKTNR